MKIIYNDIIPFKGFLAINLFGLLFVRKGGKLTDSTINHEEIHSAQMKELGYIFFYIIYFLEWIIRLFQKGPTHAAYRAISFEQEAYDNEKDPNYLKNRTPFSWLQFWKKGN